MRTLSSLIIVVAFVVLVPSMTRAQDDGSGTRGLFIQSRPKQRTKKARPRPAAAVKPATGTPDNEPAPVAPVVPVSDTGALGVGISLFRVVNQAESVRVDPASTFRSGDALRFIVEPGHDGFLYIFVRTGEGSPVMIYPDARLEDGDNFVYAHTVTEVPSRRNRGLDVFRLTGSPAVERVTFVLSRQPLPRVPIADRLVAYCAAKAGVCLWRPESETVAEVDSFASKPALVSKVSDAGKSLTAEEGSVMTRELALGASDDAPTVVAVAGAVDTPVFAYELTIRHEK